MFKEYACKVWKLCHFRTWKFFQKKITQRRRTDIPWPPSLESLACACCCCGFFGMPRDSMVIQLIVAQKVGHLSLSPRRGPVHDRNVDVHIGRKSMCLIAKALVTQFSRSLSVWSRVHKNKSMQHHTLRSGTAEFQVTWPPKLREGTYLVKNVRARFEYRKTIAAHEKQVIMQEKAQPCASLWRKTLRPKRVRFLAIDAPIVDYVCLPLYHLTFLGSYQPLCEFSWRKKKEKAR